MASLDPTAPTATEPITAMDYINSQLQLESEARETLPYSFDACARPLGDLRQALYACKTCTPFAPTPTPGFGETKSTGAAALCYSCSISCHGDHELVEIFKKRGFRCDCGSVRLPSVRCEIRKVVDEPLETIEVDRGYGQNFWGHFCTCMCLYEAEKEGGTVMYQCLLGDVCQEDWFHDVCLVGKGPPGYVLEQKSRVVEKEKEKKEEDDAPVVPTADAPATEQEDFEEEEEEEEEEDEEEEEKRAAALGFPADFEHIICWRCLDANPWLKQLAAYSGFHTLEQKQHQESEPATVVAVGTSPPTPEIELPHGHKRKPDDDDIVPPVKRVRSDLETITATATTETELETTDTPCSLPTSSTSPPETFSLLLPSDFRSSLCRCVTCFSHLRAFPVLLEAEEVHEQPLSRPASPTGSILEEGERALNNMDRVRAIEGVLAYNKLKERVKAFLKPFAQSGKVVGVEDVEEYFGNLNEKKMK